jgi:hypothetical protein
MILAASDNFDPAALASLSGELGQLARETTEPEADLPGLALIESNDSIPKIECNPRLILLFINSTEEVPSPADSLKPQLKKRKMTSDAVTEVVEPWMGPSTSAAALGRSLNVEIDNETKYSNTILS